MSQDRARPSKWTPWLLAGALLCMTAWFFPYFPSLGSPNELTRLYLTRAIVDDGSFSIDGPVSLYGRITDMARRDNQLYSDKAPGVGFFGVPVYVVVKTLAGWEVGEVSNAGLLRCMRFFLAGLPTAAVALMLFFLLGRLELSRERRLFLMMAYGLGTVAFAYGVLLYGHQLATACLLGAFFLAERQGRAPHPLQPLGTGFFLGCALMTEYTTVLMAAPLAVYTVWSSPARLRDTFLGLAGSLPPIALLMIYHTVSFGGPLTTGYTHLAHAHFAGVHERGLWGLVTPSLTRLSTILFSPSKGLWFFSPWLLLSLPAFAWAIARPGPALERLRPAWIAITLASVFYLLFASSLQLTAWGWCLGPRHLCPILPFWVLAIGTLFTRRPVWARWTLRVLRVLVPFSLVAITLPTATFGGFPPDFSNPLADFSLPLVASGCLSRSVGTWLGLPAGWAAIPFWLAALAFLFWLTWPRDAKTLEKLLIPACLAGLLALALLATGPKDPTEDRALNWVKADILRCVE
jgi:hypothetical protein